MCQQGQGLDLHARKRARSWMFCREITDAQSRPAHKTLFALGANTIIQMLHIPHIPTHAAALPRATRQSTSRWSSWAAARLARCTPWCRGAQGRGGLLVLLCMGVVEWALLWGSRKCTLDENKRT